MLPLEQLILCSFRLSTYPHRVFIKLLEHEAHFQKYIHAARDGEDQKTFKDQRNESLNINYKFQFENKHGGSYSL